LSFSCGVFSNTQADKQAAEQITESRSAPALSSEPLPAISTRTSPSPKKANMHATTSQLSFQGTRSLEKFGPVTAQARRRIDIQHRLNWPYDVAM
jgi:hypothetical protein